MRSASVLLLPLALAWTLRAQSASSISGEYVEARSGEVYTCGCLYSSEQVSAGREAILAWNLRAGEFHGTSLAGLKAAAVVVGGNNLGLAATSRRSVLYLDSGGSTEQQRALADALHAHYAAALGEIIGIHTAPISFRKDNDWTYLRVGEVVNLDVRNTRLPDDAHQGSSLWYGPFIPLANPALATTIYYRFWGADFHHQWWDREPGITGYTGEFAL